MRRAVAIAAAALAAALLGVPAALAQDQLPPPHLVRAVADSLTTVQVQVNEPLDPASVQTSDFTLEMVEAIRPVTAVSVSPDGMRVTLTSSRAWDPGTAGRVQLVGPGVVNDRAGIPNSSGDWVTVGAAPGDFTAPVVTRFTMSRRHNLCWDAGPRCRRPRSAWIYRVTEDGDAYITVFRGSRRIGVRRYNGQPGDNFINFDGKIGGRRLRPGKYTAQIGVKDDVGNMTPPNRQPHTSFSVKSTRGRR